MLCLTLSSPRDTELRAQSSVLVLRAHAAVNCHGTMLRWESCPQPRLSGSLRLLRPRLQSVHEMPRVVLLDVAGDADDRLHAERLRAVTQQAQLDTQRLLLSAQPQPQPASTPPSAALLPPPAAPSASRLQFEFGSWTLQPLSRSMRATAAAERPAAVLPAAAAAAAAAPPFPCPPAQSDFAAAAARRLCSWLELHLDTDGGRVWQEDEAALAEQRPQQRRRKRDGEAKGGAHDGDGESGGGQAARLDEQQVAEREAEKAERRRRRRQRRRQHSAADSALTV